MKDFFDYFKGNFFIKLLLFLYALLASWFTNAQTHEIAAYKPKNIALQEEIIKMDSIFFNAYNTCDIKTQRKILSDNIEFFMIKADYQLLKKKF